MASILRIKDMNGIWHDIPAVRGLSAYEIALQNGFVGSEEEWIKKVEAEARMAEEARVAADGFADQALQSAQNASIAEESAYTQANRAYDQAERAMEYANAAGDSATSSHTFAEEATTQAGIATEQALIAQHNAMDSSGNVTAANDFAEQAKASADKAEQYANEMSGVLPNIEAGLSLRPTTQQVKAMHEEDMAGTYNIRKIPEGKTIDDLYLEEDYGLYMIDDEVPFGEEGFTSRGSQLIVTGGYYYEEGFGDKSTTCQVLLCHNGFEYLIKQRSLQNGKWSAWEDVFATKDYVDSVNIKINEIIDSAPDALNTLKELADALNNEPDFAGTVANSLANKVDKESGKGLSTEDYTTEEKKLLSELDNDMGEVGDALEEIEKIQNMFIEGDYVGADQTYDPTSKNAQSGIAVAEAIAKIPTGGGGETWELLQSHEVTEEDGELSELRITFPEGYKEYVVSLERTAPTESTNTIIYPYGKKAGGGTEGTAFWDCYEGGKASHYELRFSSMELDADNYIKLEGYTYVSNQPVKGKPQTMKTSGWFNVGMLGNKVVDWHSVLFNTKLNVGSKYKVWGCK